MKEFQELANQYQDYLTFYDECRIPKHPFFDIEKNQNNEKLLVVSSPSRMGNHLVMSMLDGHPELPLVPGEDGIHMFSFTQANHDIFSYMQRLRSEANVEAIMDIASNGGGSKWRQFSEITSEADFQRKGYSGVGGKKHSAVVDFEGVFFDINFSAYEDELKKHADSLRQSDHYNELLVTYARAIGKLDTEPRQTKYDSYFVHGAMRTQLLWLCQTMPNVKILSSVRSFPSYAVSQIKSRYGDVELTDEKLQVAWEHWFHKVVDMIYLRLHYPAQFGLITFDGLVDNPAATQRSICEFLEIGFTEALNTATIMGFPVKGNSWESRSLKTSGQYYKPSTLLHPELVPPRAKELWELVLKCQLVETNK